jgi:hypothetical protein
MSGFLWSWAMRAMRLGVAIATSLAGPFALFLHA